MMACSITPSLSAWLTATVTLGPGRTAPSRTRRITRWGYPALIGLAYALGGPRPLCAMLVNALVGALLVVGVHACALRVTSLARARLAALAVALHPTLILYTAALMTEAVAAAGLILLCAYALRARAKQAGWAWRLPIGVGGGLLVLIRPQLLPLVPLLGAAAVSVPAQLGRGRELVARLRGGAEVLLLALMCCAPWTARNCAKMDGCVFVSANGGWNLLIGTLPEGQGSFAPIAGPTVPPECRSVFGEAAKDRCFGRAGLRRLRAEPAAWLALVPRKLGQLFDHSAVASSYLQTSNGGLVTDRVKLVLATAETLWSRLLLLGACFGLFRASPCWWGRGFSLGGALFTLSPWGYLAQLGVLGALWRDVRDRAAGRFSSSPRRFLGCASSPTSCSSERRATAWFGLRGCPY